MQKENCPFCNKENLMSRTIREDEWCISVISSPWFRTGHCLVIPRRHLTTIDELNGNEIGAIMKELGRLARHLDQGYGSGIMQKVPTIASREWR